jgi:hypothetical protein
MQCESLDSNVLTSCSYIIIMIRINKTLLIELLLKLRILISILIFLGIDLGLNLNDDIESNKIKPISTSTNDNNVPVITTPPSTSTSTIPTSISNNIEERMNNIKKHKLWKIEAIENGFNAADKLAFGFISGIGLLSFKKAPSLGAKLAIGSISFSLISLSAIGFSLSKNITIDNLRKNSSSLINTIDNSNSTNISRPPSPGCGDFNLIDTNQFYNKFNSFINSFDNIDDQYKLIFISILILLICFIYILYIFSFVIAPSIFDVIKDHLPIKFNNLIIKFININRKISVPFIILSFISLILCLLVAIFLLTTMVYLNNLNP